MFRNKVKSLLTGAIVIAAAATSAFAANHDVTVSNFSFSPADITIDTGDTVTWTWAGGFHNVESGVGGTHDGNFRSGDPTSTVGTMFSVTFDQAFLNAHPMANNEYPYYCAIHFGGGMVGSVTVNPAQPACPADLTGAGDMPDGMVDVSDLFRLLSNWNTNGQGADLAAPTNIVDVSDLFVLLAAWGDC